LVLRNLKATDIANLIVKVDSLKRIDRDTPQAKNPQFTGMPIKIERGSQEMTLPGNDTRELWVAQHARGDDEWYMLTSEPAGRYRVDLGEYELKILAIGNGAAPAKPNKFRIKVTKRGLLDFEALPVP